MNTAATTRPADPACLHGGAQWRDDLLHGDAASRSLEGAHLVSHSLTLRQGESVEDASGDAGEEVGTVLAGEFRIEAAGESYELTVGEGIVIPPRAVRRWTCLSPQGALYRVLTRLDALPAGVEAAA